jgi:hypothetical protein
MAVFFVRFMRLWRIFGSLVGSIPLFCATAQQQPTRAAAPPSSSAQPPATSPGSPDGPTLSPEERQRLFDRLSDLLDEEGRRIGDFTAGGAGFRIADTDYGTLNFSVWSYARYLNQKNLDETYTDAFGRTKTLDLRNDLQLNKVNLYFKGWIYDPKFSYMFFVWTQNAQMGDGAQVVLGGGLDYSFSQQVNIGAGVTQNPGTRSLRGTFPYWNRVDTRMIADEFHRPSYTTGLYVYGNVAHGLQYKAVLGNNLSQLGVNAVQLDGEFNTFSASLNWTPQGDFGGRAGWGDFEYHEELVTNVGFGITHSREDRQSQPGETTIENSQIRLSDGTRLFEDGAFGTVGRVNKATYKMVSLDAAAKIRGWDFSAGYYKRLVDDFDTEGFIPVDELNDWGYQIQVSKMVVPEKLAAYVGYSKIFGEYGDPYDYVLGINWYPFRQRLLRMNTELMYLRNSPVGYPSVPMLVGGNGTVFMTSLEMVF